MRKILFATLFAILVNAPDLPQAVAAATGEDRPVPQIDKLVPSSLDACSLQAGRKITVTGEFPAGTRVLLDGAGIGAEKAGEGEIVFTLPPLKGGLHQVAVAGPGNRLSLPQSLFVDTVPKITAVSRGEDQVTAYEVIIRGVNFLFDSTLVINDVALRPARREEAKFPPPAGGRDYVRYEDCSTLVYIRHPVTREPRNITLRVVNPGGEQSPAYEVEIP